jgi:hypothetical protein
MEGNKVEVVRKQPPRNGTPLGGGPGGGIQELRGFCVFHQIQSQGFWPGKIGVLLVEQQQIQRTAQKGYILA